MMFRRLILPAVLSTAITIFASGYGRADLGTALDNGALSLSAGGDGSWYEDFSTTAYGNSSARSGVVGANQSTWIQASLNGPGTISFYWKVSSESSNDNLQVLVDGVLKAQISGNVDWTSKAFTITGTGSHMVKWQYAKNGSISSGSDAGWVDQVTWSGYTALLWSTKASILSPVEGMGMTEANGRIYVISGYNSGDHNYLQEYNPATNTWAYKTGAPTIRRNLAAASLGGTIYAIGGSTTSNNQCVSTVERYDTVTDTWATVSALHATRSWPAVVAANSRIYAIGGYASGYKATVESYDPDNNSWTSLPDMPSPRDFMAWAVIGAKIYIIGGYDGTSLKSVLAYDTSTTTWSWKADMPQARHLAAATVVNGKIYVVGGITSAGTSSDVIEYNPSTNIWTSRTAMGTARSNPGAATVNGKIYVVGGKSGSSFVNTVEEGTFTTAGTLASTTVYAGEGKLIVAPNVLDRSNLMATRLGLNVKGAANGTVTVVIFDETGGFVDSVDINLDSSGYGVKRYTGPGNSVLAPGVYWAKASGSGVNDKKRFMVISRRKR